MAIAKAASSTPGVPGADWISHDENRGDAHATPGQPSSGLRTRPQQFDLFAQPADDGQALMPEWRTLPAETRQALTNLMVRLILDHARRSRSATGRGAP